MARLEARLKTLINCRLEERKSASWNVPVISPRIMTLMMAIKTTTTISSIKVKPARNLGLTGSGGCILPVADLDRIAVAAARPEIKTRFLMRAGHFILIGIAPRIGPKKFDVGTAPFLFVTRGASTKTFKPSSLVG